MNELKNEKLHRTMDGGDERKKEWMNEGTKRREITKKGAI